MRSFPWDSIVEAMGDDGLPIYDRAYSASDLQDIMTIFFSNGVFMNTNNALQVTAGANMTVLVAPGRGMIRGTSCLESSSRALEMVASSSKDRIDTVVLRWDANLEQRNIDLYVVQGVASDSPVRPQLTRTETIYELGLADVFVPKNTTAISDERITDTRLETERCGIATPFAKIDTTTFYNQINAAINKQVGELQEQTDKAVELAQNAIDGTTAGNLQHQINRAVLSKPRISITKEDDTPYFWAEKGSVYAELLYTDSSNDENQGGIIVSCVASFAYNTDGSFSPGAGAQVTQYLVTWQGENLYFRTGYYRAAEYNDGIEQNEWDADWKAPMPPDHSIGQQQLEASVWDSISRTREVTISNIRIAGKDGVLVRTDIPAMAGYKAVGVVGMKIGSSLHTMYWGLENNNTRLRADFINRASTEFSGSPGVAVILYLKNS